MDGPTSEVILCPFKEEWVVEGQKTLIEGGNRELVFTSLNFSV